LDKGAATLCTPKTSVANVAEKEINPKLTGRTAAQCGASPVDKSVDPLLRNFVDFRPAPPGNDPDCSVYSIRTMKAFTGTLS